MNKPDNKPDDDALGSDTPDGDAAGAPHTWTSEQLLQGNVEAVIQHQEEKYRLRLTRQGKLILYK